MKSKVVFHVANFCFNATYNSTIWYGYGCSHYMIGNNANLLDYVPYLGGNDSFGDGVQSSIVGSL